MLTLVALITVFVTSSSADRWILVSRGHAVTCTVNDVTDNVVDHVDGVRQTFRDHHLDCPGGQSQIATSEEARSRPGQSLEVTYDPDGQFQARPTVDLNDWRRNLGLAIGAFTVALLIGAGELLIDKRRQQRITS